MTDTAPSLREALEIGLSEVIADRDAFYDGITLPDGTIDDDNDREELARLDGVIDTMRAALAAHDSGEELSDLIARLTKERDEAYRKGQEDMRGRAAKVCFQTRGSTIAGTRIRALKIKGAPDAE